jgi:hypothetical protein
MVRHCLNAKNLKSHGERAGLRTGKGRGGLVYSGAFFITPCKYEPISQPRSSLNTRRFDSHNL